MAKKPFEDLETATNGDRMTQYGRKRGRPARTKQYPPDLETGCGRLKRYRNGVYLPCECKSCKGS